MEGPKPNRREFLKQTLAGAGTLAIGSKVLDARANSRESSGRNDLEQEQQLPESYTDTETGHVCRDIEDKVRLLGGESEIVTTTYCWNEDGDMYIKD